MDESIKVLHQFGVMGLWGIILFQILELVKIITVLLLVGFGIKLAFPHIKKILDL